MVLGGLDLNASSLDSVASVNELLADYDYISSIGLSTSLFLALKMRKAIFLEGEPGVGKTEVAKVLSQAFDTPLIRLQCYEGLDVSLGGIRVELSTPAAGTPGKAIS